MKPLFQYLLKAKTILCIIVSAIIILSSFAPPPPSNDECAGAITLTSGLSCNNIQYDLKNTTASAGIPVGCAPVGTHYDVWFLFTAASTSQTVTISNLQNNFTNPAIQLFSGACGTLTSVACGTSTMTATGLSIGSTYYIRVSNVGGSTPGNQFKFDICVTHPPATPANDNCSGATTLTSNATCSNTTGNLYYATSLGPAGACAGTLTTTYEVWFRFQAVNANQTVTVGGLGSRLTTATTYMEVLSGTCGSLVSLGCQTVATASGRRTITGLTVGTFYYARVFVLANPIGGISSDWNFNICIQHPPANDECTGAVALTPGAACVNTAGTLDLATLNAGTPIGCFAAGNYFDVWYTFVATGVSHTVTLSSLGANFTVPRIQLYRGTCAGLISVACVSATTITQAGLTIGFTYYIRVANFNVNPSGLGTVANFNICVTAAAAPPANDLCANAFILTSSTSCSNVSGTLINATATAGIPGLCGNNASPEVWYSFVAQSTYPSITLSNIGANLLTASPRIQLFSGTCGVLTSLACITVSATPTTLNTRTTPGGAGLIVGATYYIRITTNNLLAPVAAGSYNFFICITDPAAGAVMDYAKSYVNISAGTVGGTVNPGDELEIRATLVINRNAGIHHGVDSIAFYDTLSPGNGFALKANNLALRTNEGKLFLSYTDLFDAADAGWYSTAGAGADTTIQMNMGTGATRFARGKLRSNSTPSFFTNTCIVMATYRVIVNAGYNTKIEFGGGRMTYRDSVTGISYNINFPKDSLMVFQSQGICPNSTTQSNILGDEFNGTFGVPTGAPPYLQNRGSSSSTNYVYTNFAAGAPQDYQYGIANNTSAAGTTVQTVPKGNAARVHTVFDISGDHTNATNTAKGNNPCNLSLPISSTNPCGYMIVVNAAYRTDLAFSFNVSGACPNTYYEVSAWFKNVCYKCGCDVQGRGTGSAGYIPTATGDSSGVRPNVAYQINGIDYYTTGDILYQGLGGTQTGSDTLNNWVRRAFVYRTGPSETNFTLTLRNNAPGGGGNDWALDDISLRTCFPNMNYSPSASPTVCAANIITITDTVRSFYNTYVEYKWQTSTDGGVTWVDIPGTTATASPTMVNGMWQYVTSYTIPTSATTAGNNDDLYRVVVATTTSNLSSSTCNFSDPTSITLTVLTGCGPVLSTDLLTVSGRLILDKAKISWVTSTETGIIKYSIERSDDGINFTSIGILNGYNNINSEKNYYSYDDPRPVTGKVYYRIVVMSGQTTKKYSRTIQLSLIEIRDWELGAVVNPFYNEIQYEISSPVAAMAKVELIDNYGKVIKTSRQQINTGVNALILNNTSGIPTGIYLLKVSINDHVAIRKVMKGLR
ncbi:MAG: T9SS type A sorting domain-containing protein [Bacteroidota bacterium]|nr:T9SS type A sorting domain-containing protein [Bacteroidota bacterium]